MFEKLEKLGKISGPHYPAFINQNHFAFLKDLCEKYGFEKVKQIISNTSVFLNSWTNKGFFKELKSILNAHYSDRDVFVYLSNIVQCLNEKKDINNVFAIVENLRPKGVITTDSFGSAATFLPPLIFPGSDLQRVRKEVESFLTHKKMVWDRLLIQELLGLMINSMPLSSDENRRKEQRQEMLRLKKSGKYLTTNFREIDGFKKEFLEFKQKAEETGLAETFLNFASFVYLLNSLGSADSICRGVSKVRKFGLSGILNPYNYFTRDWKGYAKKIEQKIEEQFPSFQK